ncbi:MAG: hypothetical protein ACYTGZ_11940 [Planctomycetota bacterium]|jgi:hypothetical protein
MKIIAALTPALVFVALFAAPSTAGPSSARQLVNTLQQRRISVKFDAASLDDVVKYVHAATGINIVVRKHKIAADGGDADAIEISLKVRNVTVLDFLKLAFEPQDLGLAVRNNVLLITSKKDARGKPVLRMYDVSHLLVQIRDFPAPDINVYPSSFEPPEAPEPEIHQAVESSEEIAELIRNFVGQGTWEDEGVALHVFRRHLFVRTYPKVHRQVAHFLVQLNALR